MLKQEFATGHQCPQEIFHDAAAFGLGCHLENFLKPFTFRVAGVAGEAEQVGFVDNIAVTLRDYRVYTALFAAEVIIERVAIGCLLYTSPSPRDQRGSRMPSSA